MSWQQRVRAFEHRFDYDRSEDWRKTEALKTRIAEFRASNPNAGLSLGLFDAITDWKLRKQRGRTEKHREVLTEQLLGQASKCVFQLQHHDPEVLASVQSAILASLPGIGLGLSTAILALTFPASHGVIDFRVWKVVFGIDKRSFTVQNYIVYLRELRAFARESAWSVQMADFMIWSYHDQLTSVSTRTRRKRRVAFTA